jgi:hypothetical protein
VRVNFFIEMQQNFFLHFFLHFAKPVHSKLYSNARDVDASRE